MRLSDGHIPVLTALLAAAALEEIIFRAGLQETLLRHASRSRLLRKHAAGVSLSNLSSAVLFAVAHGVLRPWLLAAAVFPPALLLGWLYERHRKLWPCIALHAVMNGLWFAAVTTWADALAARP